jgi:hypothetical protein
MRPALLLLVACQKEPEGPPVDTDPAPEQPKNDFPLPDDLDEIDFVTAFQEAARLMVTVNTQQPWRGHSTSLQARGAGCPDFWTDPFTVGGLEVVGSEEGVSWYDDCLLDSGRYYDGWVWWDFDVQEAGDATTLDGRVSEASRVLDGDAVVGDADGVRFEFDGQASDSLYQVEAYGYRRFVYSTSMDATVTGADVFTEESLTPGGFRTDLFMFTTGGDVETFEARGNVYLFAPAILDRFDSIGVDMALPGELGAAPTDCVLEPLGWMGLRDENAYWYDVVFLPRFREDIVGEEYPNDPLSVCDGCGRLYVQGVEQEGMDVCVDFSFLFDEFPLPDPDEYVLPMHAL